MKRKWYRHPLAIRVAGVVALLALSVLIEVGAYFSNVMLPWHRQEAIEATLLWGGLAELPSTATNVSVTTSGSMFTRTFDLKFEAPDHEIRRWIAESPRLSENTPQNRERGVDRYEIYPGEQGAVGDWVEVRYQGAVVIHMSWS